MKEQLEKDGYIILREFFDPIKINDLQQKSVDIFNQQFYKLGYNIFKPDTEGFKNNMIRLFNEHNETFKNCGKLIQTGLIELYKLSVNNKLIKILEELGIETPLMCTRPVLFFNHPKLAKSEEYYKTPMHQDWPSMEASQNSLVVWVPLVDVNKENGSIIIYPGSHKNGILPFTTEGGFAKVEYEGESIQPEMKVGDVAIFSTKLVHESGPILNDTIRWSCHFRYTDILEQDFIERGYPNPYIYKPVTKM
jgi:ectoine hydroxylase-related dioxygenase (phytanoyl-CoA dioxygenase family)